MYSFQHRRSIIFQNHVQIPASISSVALDPITTNPVTLQRTEGIPYYNENLRDGGKLHIQLTRQKEYIVNTSETAFQ